MKASDVTDMRYAYLEQWWTDALEVLGLNEWRGLVERDAPEDDDGEPLAAVFVRFEANYYRLRVAERFWDVSERDQRYALAHELMHLPTFHWGTDALEQLKSALSRSASDTAETLLSHAFERMVDRLGAIVAPRLAEFNCPSSEKAA